MTLSSSPECHAVFSQMPHFLVSVNQCFISSLSTLTPPEHGHQGWWVGGRMIKTEKIKQQKRDSDDSNRRIRELDNR
jgi:hypothetical protein